VEKFDDDLGVDNCIFEKFKHQFHGFAQAERFEDIG
jgi:hypothetical protein